MIIIILIVKPAGKLLCIKQFLFIKKIFLFCPVNNNTTGNSLPNTIRLLVNPFPIIFNQKKKHYL